MWGTFRDSSGPIGLLTWGQLEKTPVKVELPTRNGDAVVKVASGADHLALLTRDGDIWTLGNLVILDIFCFSPYLDTQLQVTVSRASLAASQRSLVTGVGGAAVSFCCSLTRSTARAGAGSSRTCGLAATTLWP